MTSFQVKLADKLKSHAYMQGVDAFKLKISCIYSQGTKEYEEWHSGFEDAEFLDEVLNSDKN